LRKLKLYLINVHNKIINEIQNDIKRLKNENKERKGHSISKKNIKFNNKNKLIIQLSKKNLVLSATTNKSMFNLFNPQIPFELNHKEKKDIISPKENTQIKMLTIILSQKL